MAGFIGESDTETEAVGKPTAKRKKKKKKKKKKKNNRNKSGKVIKKVNFADEVDVLTFMRLQGSRLRMAIKGQSR